MGSSSSSPAADIPEKTKRLVCVAANEKLENAKFEVQEIDTPVPQSGEVLVRVAAAPMNPSDFGNFRRAARDNDSEQWLGKEGSGVVVASGGGMKANGLVGSKVGIANLKGGGTYQEYVCANAMTSCFPLPDDVPVEDGCSFFVNPYTAVGIVATAKERGSPGFVHTAAASQLGQMLVKYCKQEGMTLINVVRREDQAEMLRDLGAEHIVVSSKEGWEDELKELVKKLNISVAFDCIAGSSTGTMMDVMPNNGSVFCYGGLSEEPISGIQPMDLIYRHKKLEGWFLPDYLKGASGGTMGMAMRINGMSKIVDPGLANGWSSSKFVDAEAEKFWPAFLEMRNGGGFTNKKLRIRWPQPVAPEAGAAPASEAAPAAEAAA